MIAIGMGNTRSTNSDNNNVVATPSEILQEIHYDPFGYGLDGAYMNHALPDNQYQYNGKEKNDDHGIGLYDYGARWYDAGVGRFTSIDRFAPKYSSMNPYQYGANNPIKYIDVNGDSLRINTGGGNYAYYNNGSLINQDGSQYTGPGTRVRKDGSVRLKGDLRATVNALNRISGGGTAGNEIVSNLVGNSSTFTINISESNSANNRNANWNPRDGDGGLDVTGGNSRPAFIGLAHELAHLLDYNNGTLNRHPWFSVNGRDVAMAEIFGSNYENRIRNENNIPLRAYYTDSSYPDAALLSGSQSRYPSIYPTMRQLPRREIISVSSQQ